jgi:hypothetical protein
VPDGMWPAGRGRSAALFQAIKYQLYGRDQAELNHTFRGTGISANLENETLEKVRQMRVGHRLCARIPPSHREGVPYLTGIPGPM